MRSTCRTMLLALLAVLALSAVAASAAQAAVEGPFYKIAGSRLASGESKEVKITTRSGIDLYLDIYGTYIKCTTQGFAAGSKLLGSTGANGGAGEVTLELSGCKYSGDGSGECGVVEPIKTYPLTAKLVYLNSERKGRLAVEFTPTKGSKFGRITITGKGCAEETYITGDLVAGLYSGEKPVEVGKEPAEAKTMELDLTLSPQPADVWVEKAGELVKTAVGELDYGPGGLQFTEGTNSTLELAGGANWGVFT
jgi:hypothetical protein